MNEDALTIPLERNFYTKKDTTEDAFEQNDFDIWFKLSYTKFFTDFHFR